MRVRFTVTAAIAIVSIPIAQLYEPSVKADDQGAKIAVSMARFGVTFFRGLNAEINASAQVTPDLVKTSDVQTDAKLLASKYEAELKAANETANFASAGIDFATTTVVAIGASSGVGAVPAALFAAGANWANDQATASIRAVGQERAKTFLRTSLDSWDSAKGIKYDEIRVMLANGDEVNAAKAFDNATGMLTTLRDLMPDEDGKKAAEALLLKTMRDTDEVTLRQTAANAAAISQVQQGLADSVQFTKQLADNTYHALKEHADELQSLDAKLTDASKGIYQIQQDQTATKNQIASLRAMLYDQQPPHSKLYMLKNGMGPPSLSDVQKKGLIDYYEAEQRKQDFIQGSSKFVNTANQLQQIAANLNFSDPNVNKAIAYASVAQNAMSQAILGNYIGAIVSVTGIFGSREDPQQRQFAAIMGFLHQIDQKLDEVIALQKQTLQAIETLSFQVNTMQRHLDNRLDVIDFEMKTISDNLKKELWKDYLACGNADQNRTNQGAEFDEETFQFRSVRDLMIFVDSYAGKAIECARALDDLFLSPKNSKVFGGLLSLSTALQTDYKLLPTEQAGKSLTNEQLQAFRDGLYSPAVTVVLESWKNAWGAQANLLALLSVPSPTVSEVLERTARLESATGNGNRPYSCSKPTLVSQRLRALLCETSRYSSPEPESIISSDKETRASEQFLNLIQDPMIRDQLPSLVRWTGLTSRAYDLWTSTNELVFTLSDIAAGKGSPHGKDLIWSLLGVLDVAIAQQTMLHGDVSAKFAYDAIWRGDGPKAKGDNALENAAIVLLKNENNPWLRKNVLMFALDKALFPTDAKLDVSIPYESSLAPFFDVSDPATSSEEDLQRINAGNFFMKSLFKLPDSARFEAVDIASGASKIRKVYLLLNEYRFEMPSVEEFKTRRLSYPPSLVELLRLRKVMAERFVDYTVLEALKGEERARYSSLLMMGLSGR